MTSEEAQAKLPEIVRQLQSGKDLTITDHELFLCACRASVVFPNIAPQRRDRHRGSQIS